MIATLQRWFGTPDVAVLDPPPRYSDQARRRLEDRVVALRLKADELVKCGLRVEANSMLEFASDLTGALRYIDAMTVDGRGPYV